MRRLTLVISLTCLAALVGVGAPSLAGVPNEADSMVIDPTSGPPGTEIAVAGSGCSGKGELEVLIALLDTDGDEQDGDLAVPEGLEGAWEATVTVPADTTDYGEWVVVASCEIVDEEVALFGRSAGRGQSEGSFRYDERIFTVLAPTPTPTPTPTPAPTGGTAPAAVAAAAAPTFTG